MMKAPQSSAAVLEKLSVVLQKLSKLGYVFTVRCLKQCPYTQGCCCIDSAKDHQTLRLRSIHIRTSFPLQAQ